MCKKKRLNIISLNESKNKVTKEYNKSALMVKEEVLGKSLVELLEKLNIVLEEYYDINLFKLPDSLPIMLDTHHVKGLEQHAPHLLMLDIQHVIDLEQHVEFPDPLPLTYNEEDKDNSN